MNTCASAPKLPQNSSLHMKQMEGFLMEAGVKYYYDQEKSLIVLEPIKADNKAEVDMIMGETVGDRTNLLIFYSRYSSLAPIPAARLIAVSEFIQRANHGMLNGNFELDLSKGKIFYKTVINLTGCPLNKELLLDAIKTNMNMAIGYYPGIVAVIEGKSPEEAIQFVEKKK